VDENEDGEVSDLEFRKAVRALGFQDCSDRDIDHVFRDYDEDGSGSVSRLELERRLKKYAGVLAEQKYKLRRNAGGRKGAALAPSVKLDRTSGVPVSEQLREALAANSVRVIDLFRDWDENADGLISKDEFVKAMAPLGLSVSRAEAAELFDKFDPDGSGTIEFRELNQLLRRRVDVEGQKQKARRLKHSQSLPGGRTSALLLPQPTIPTYAPIPSVASLGRFEATLGCIAHTHLTDFENATFTAAGSVASHALSSLSATRGGRASRDQLHDSSTSRSQKGDRLFSHYQTLGMERPAAVQLTQSASLPSLVASEVSRYHQASSTDAALRRRTTALLGSEYLPTNVWDWPAVEGVPSLDLLAQLWMAPRIGPAWRQQPNQTRVCLPPLSSRIEALREQREQESQGRREGERAKLKA